MTTVKPARLSENLRERQQMTYRRTISASRSTATCPEVPAPQAVRGGLIYDPPVVARAA